MPLSLPWDQEDEPRRETPLRRYPPDHAYWMKRCPVDGHAVAQHCTSNHCPWLRCTRPGCFMTFDPGYGTWKDLVPLTEMPR